jgi:hypothetical protein
MLLRIFITARLRVRLQAEVRPSDYPEIALQKNMRTMNEAEPCTHVREGSAAKRPADDIAEHGLVCLEPHAAAITMIVARAQAKRPRTTDRTD